MNTRKTIQELVMNTERQPCKKCGAMMLPTTAEVTKGLCMPCYKRRKISSRVKSALMFIIMAAAIPFFLLIAIFRKDPWRGKWILDWLTERITIEEAEIELGVRDVEDHRWTKQWRGMVAEINAGGELWKFNSPPETWGKLRGRAGLCVVKNGKLGGVIITMMN